MREAQNADSPSTAARPPSRERSRRRVNDKGTSQINWENGGDRLYIWCAKPGGAMDIYHAWFDLKPGVSDTEFSDRLAAYMNHLKAEGLMQSWRLTRRKLGLSAAPVGEFHLMMEFSGLAQLARAFNQVGRRRATADTVHVRV